VLGLFINNKKIEMYESKLSWPNRGTIRSHAPGRLREMLEALGQDVPTKIQTGFIQNRNPQVCYHAILLGEVEV